MTVNCSYLFVESNFRNAFEIKAKDEDYESMDEKLADLLEAKEGVDDKAPNADLKNKYLKKKKYIRTPHGDLESKSFTANCI